MWKRVCVGSVFVVVIGVFCAVGFVGCSTGGGGGGGNRNVNDNGGGGNDNGGNDNVAPPPAGQYATGLTFDPNFNNLPRAINPYAAATNAQLPPSADLTKDVPPIGDQGQMGSCTAWASGYGAATYTANRQFQWGAETDEHQASPGHLYARLVEADAAQGTACGTGTLISTAMNLLVQEGCASLATVGYSDQQCLEPSLADAANFQIGSFKRVEPTDRNGVKAELAAGNVVVIGAQLYDDFMQYTGGAVYHGSGVFLMQGQQHAAHALACVGYDDSLGAYRIMNSWTTQWGDAGFMWMAYETFEATVFEIYALLGSGDRDPPDPEPGPGPEPQPQPDPNGYLDDAFQFEDEDPLSGEVTVYLVFYYHFDAPVLIHTITVTDPNGDQGQQTYETWYADGYVAFTKTGGFQWTPGTYTVEFDTTTENGNNITYTGEADVAGLDGGGGGEDQVCDDFCVFAYDGECDDGGPGSDFAICEYGSDCSDCGPRDKQGGGGGCADTCPYAGDGECDDGGAGADYAVCDYGTDCSDCGTREGGGGDGELCDDYCPYAYDDECDDGGDNSVTSVCDYGSDCSDCGSRSGDGGGGGSSLCEDTCEFAGDGACDDGGPDSDFNLCDYGTDCSDCGSREAAKVRQVKSTAHVFRGIPVQISPAAHNLPAAGVQEGDLGENGKPLVIIRAAKE